MKEFRELAEWDKAHEITIAAYEVTDKFPEKERLGLTQQIRLVSANIPIKIAQGCVREERSARIELMQLATDAAIELEYHLLLSYELNLLSGSDYDRLISGVVEVKEMLEESIEKLRSNS